MITCMVIDDEPLAVQLLEDYIARLPFLQLAYKGYSAIDALDFLKRQGVDLIFLDINLPHLSGMQFSALLPPSQAFIFTTAYSEFAVESYERNAVDYLLKPITFERFCKAIQKIPPDASPDSGAARIPKTEELFVKTGKALVRLAWAEVLFMEGMKDYVLFHTASEKHFVYKRMKELEETMPGNFSRIHLSYIVNRDKIKRIEDNQVWVGEARLPLSDKYREAFLRVISQRLL